MLDVADLAPLWAAALAEEASVFVGVVLPLEGLSNAIRIPGAATLGRACLASLRGEPLPPHGKVRPARAGAAQRIAAAVPRGMFVVILHAEGAADKNDEWVVRCHTNGATITKDQIRTLLEELVPDVEAWEASPEGMAAALRAVGLDAKVLSDAELERLAEEWSE